ncbi:methylmalonyl-CoA epimerase [Rubrobacter aplysinae]|uniref:methylmalonyl-CoA epimerase n=1 Tax=Rubrobacter aplysinae TaxID=909625 RepID=UPI00064C3C65|nr:methylmalonyl-CoA epimerase [Rubrobacter aplysinae]
MQKIHHLGYAVRSLEDAADFYQEHFGAKASEPEEVSDQGIRTVMFGVGESRIELLEPTGPDTPVGKFLDKNGEGFHHVAFEVEDLSRVLEDLTLEGVDLIDEEPRIGAGGVRMAFIHPRGAFGVLTELCEHPATNPQEGEE